MTPRRPSRRCIDANRANAAAGPGWPPRPVWRCCTARRRRPTPRPPQQLERFSAQAAAPGQAERGRVFFTSRQGGEWSCASCHGNPPTKPGKHASTGKSIDPMAPAANPKAFTDTAKVDKWFRRNCKDVLQRECSAGEKADVLAYLIGLKP